jgi:ABC-2 type transport system permease protein
LFGAVIVYYAQFIRDLHEGSWLIKIAALAIMVLASFVKVLPLYLEEADEIFLLPKEGQIKIYLAGARNIAIGFAIIFNILIAAAMLPIFVKTNELWYLLIILIVAIIISLINITNKLNRLFYSDGLFNWELAIKTEERRSHRLYSVINMFVDVKGFTTSVKRRRLFDFITNSIKKTQNNIYLYLFSKILVRDNIYFSLIIRLFILANLILVFLNGGIISIIISALFLYLLLFQIIPVYRAADNRIFPVKPELKVIALQKIIYVISLVYIVATQLCFGSLDIRERLYLLGANVVIAGLMALWYLPRKLRKG